MLLDALSAFIEEVVKNGGEVTRRRSLPATRITTNLNARGKRTGRPRPSRRSALGWDTASTLTAKNRWLKSVNGENKDFYQVVPQGAVKGVLSTDAEEAVPKPPAPPVVENGRFSQFFGDDLQEEDK